MITDVLPLDVHSRLLAPAAEIPLGEAATVLVTPAPQVHVERGHLFFRPLGSGAAVTDSLPLVLSEDLLIAVIPGEQVTEAGLEYYVRVENSGVFAYDPPGAPGEGYLQPVAGPAGLQVHARPNSPSGFTGNQPVRVDVAIPTGTVFQEGRLHYRPGGAWTYESMPLAIDDFGIGAAIPDSAVGPRGVEYWTEVTTITRTLTEPPANPEANPLVFSVVVENLEEAASSPPARYRMVSIPLDFGSSFTGTLATLLADQAEFGLYDPLRWRSFRFDPGTGTYAELANTDPRFALSPGRAFWLIAAAAGRIETAPVSGRSLPTDRAAEILLEPGWNQIGNPFAFPVAWADVAAATANAESLGVPVAWNPAANAYDPTPPATLEPFAGYFVFNNRETEAVRLVIPPREAIPVVPAAEAAEARAEWTLGITAEAAAASGRLARRSAPAVAGVMRHAADGSDALDRFDPPLAPAGGIAVYFAHDTWGARPRRLARDMRDAASPPGDGRRWVFDVRVDDAETQAATLHMSASASLPESLAAVLVDRHLDRRVDLRDAAAYPFLAPATGYRTENEARFVLLVGTPDYVATRETPGVPKPRLTRLLPAFPNPFRHAAVIRYELAEPGEVRVGVFDVRGRRIRTLEATHGEPGRYEIAWAGDGDLGAAPPGVYFLRLETARATDSRKVIKIE